MKSSTLVKRIKHFSTEDLYLFLLVLFALSINFPIPFTRNISYMIAIFWVFNYKSFDWSTLKNPIFLSTISLYLILIFGLIYSENIDKGAYKLDKGSGLLFFPFVLFTLPAISKKNIDKVILSFVIGTLLAILYCLCMSLYQLYTDGINSFYNPYYDQVQYLGWDKFGTHMPRFIVSNHVYMGLYVAFAIGCSIYLLVFLKHKLLRIFIFISFLVFIYFLFLIKATMAFLALCSSSIFIILISRIKRKIKIILFLSGVFITATAFYISKGMTKKVGELFDLNAYEVANSHPDNHLASRLGVYQCAIVVIKENLPFGSGTGDAQAALNACYKKRNYQAWLERGLNTHNQYLHYMLMLGFFGLFIFLFALFFPIVLCIKRKYYLYLFFLLLFSQCALTENLLTVNKGVMFFAFFNALFGSSLYNKF